MRIFVAAVFFALAAGAFCQSIRPMNIGSSTTRDAKRLADKQQLPWPDLRNGDSGTQISISADRRNADALITSNIDVDTLLKIAQSAAKELGLPKTDFLTRQGPTTATVDMEFNDYLVRQGSKTSFTYPIGKLVSILNRNSTLRPVVLYIEGDIEEQVLVTNGQPKPLPADTPVLLNEKQLDGISDLRVTAIQAWWSPIAGWIALLAMIGFLGALFLAPMKLIASLRKVGEEREPEPTKRSPEEVQAQYDDAIQKQNGKRFGWLTGTWPFLGVLLLVFRDLPAARQVGRQITYGLPDYFLTALSSLNPAAVIAVGLVPGSIAMAAVFFIKKRKTHAPSKISIRASFLWLMFGTFYMLLCVATIPSLNGKVEAAWIRPVIYTPLAVIFACAAWSMYRERERSLTFLGANDPIRVMAEDLGNRAGVRVRRVVVKDEDQFVNAFATFFGTIGITRALRDQLPEDEIRAILAHEVGHLKARDVPRFFVQSLGMFAAVFGVLWCLDQYSPAYRQSGFSALVAPLACVAAIPITWLMAPRRKKAEIAADRFAAQISGVKTFKRAITRIHDLNGVPHRLDPSTVKLLGHPDLATRLKRLDDLIGE